MASPIRYRGYAFHHHHHHHPKPHPHPHHPDRRNSHPRPPPSPNTPKEQKEHVKHQHLPKTDMSNITLDPAHEEYVPGPNMIQYEIRVVTGDVMGAGTDANVYITLAGEDGDSGRQQLTKKYTNLFERGRTDCFVMDMPMSIGKLTKLRIEHDDTGFGAAWLLDRVEIVNTLSNRTTVFLCGEWLDSHHGTIRDLNQPLDCEEGNLPF